MRTKLFFAFFIIILTALVSNLIFENLIISDFEDYAMGEKEDRLYWVLASVEGTYSEGSWDLDSLVNYLHWASMLGYDVEVRDSDGELLLSSETAMRKLSSTMRRRMEAIVDLDSPEGEFEAYPLFVEGLEIGSLMVRELDTRGHLKQKELVFKRRGRDFLVMSFLIAGGGAVFLSIVFSLFLTLPLKRLRLAAEQVSRGDLGVRVETRSSDEIGKLTETFNHMVESLDREEKLRAHLTSNIAHELRTPLAVVKAHLEAARDGVIECGKETIDTVYTEVERLVSLVEGIEDITKAEASFFKHAALEEVDIKSVAEGLVQSMRPMFEGKGVEVIIMNESPLPVTTDAEKVEIIFRNILTNALKHTPAGNVWIDFGRDRKEFFFEVRDSGTGIADKDLPFIFKRFYRGEGSTGIGLGLSIARELAEIMGGRIDAASAGEKGSVFRVTLPLRDEHA